MRDTEKLGGYYEMPMAISVKIVMPVMIVRMVRLVIAAMIVAVLMVLVVMTMAMAFLCTLFVGLARFDMDMGNVVVRVAMPQCGAELRYRSGVEQE